MRPELVVFVLLAVALVGSVAVWAVDLPHYDEWVLAEDLAASDLGELVQRAWTPHNEHRLLVPRLLLVGLARVTSWNVRVECLLVAACALAVGGLVWWLGARVEGRAERAIFRGVGVLLALGLHQVSNLVWGWQLSVFLCVLGSIAALALLAEVDPRRGRLVAALAVAWLATFSYGAGLATWPAGAVVLAARAAGEQSRRAVFEVAAWSALGVATTVVYLGGVPSEGGFALATLLHGLAFLASPLLQAWPSAPLAVGCGALGVVLAAVGLWRLRQELTRRDGEAARTWLGLVLFGLGVAALTALGRAELGPAQALSSRYTTLANVFWVGTLGLWVRPGAFRGGAVFVPAVIGLGVLSGSAASIEAFRGQHELRTVVRRFLVRGVLLEEISPLVGGDVATLRRYATVACRQRVGVYRDDRGATLDCELEVWPESVEGRRSLAARRFEILPDAQENPIALRDVAGFTFPIGPEAVEGRWRQTRDNAARRCIRGWVVDTRTGSPVAEVIVADGTSARRLDFRREPRGSGGSGDSPSYIGISGCWVPEPELSDAPVRVFATNDRGLTGPLDPPDGP